MRRTCYGVRRGAVPDQAHGLRRIWLWCAASAQLVAALVVSRRSLGKASHRQRPVPRHCSRRWVVVAVVAVAVVAVVTRGRRVVVMVTAATSRRASTTAPKPWCGEPSARPPSVIAHGATPQPSTARAGVDGGARARARATRRLRLQARHRWMHPTRWPTSCTLPLHNPLLTARRVTVDAATRHGLHRPILLGQRPAPRRCQRPNPTPCRPRVGETTTVPAMAPAVAVAACATRRHPFVTCRRRGSGCLGAHAGTGRRNPSATGRPTRWTTCWPAPAARCRAVGAAARGSRPGRELW